MPLRVWDKGLAAGGRKKGPGTEEAARRGDRQAGDAGTRDAPAPSSARPAPGGAQCSQ
jgi:hypothetical protein